MSSIYIQEPPTTAHLILETTQGPLEIQLWCKECPNTTRRFLEQALQGHLNNVSFDRLVPGVCLQSSDIQGDRLSKEVHSRLRFTRRGLLASVASDSGQCQSSFFLTLNATPGLNGTTTLFGKVVGDSIFNLVRMGEAEVDSVTEKPTHPVKITNVKVLESYFKDLVVAELKQEKREEKKEKEKKIFQKNLLSFDATSKRQKLNEPVKLSESVSSSIGPSAEELAQQKRAAMAAQIASLKADLRKDKRKQPETPPPTQPESVETIKQKSSAVGSLIASFKDKAVVGKRRIPDDAQTLAALQRFRNKLSVLDDPIVKKTRTNGATRNAQLACSLHGVIECGSCKSLSSVPIEQTETSTDWLTHRLQCPDSITWREDVSQLQVLDPRIGRVKEETERVKRQQSST